MRLRFLGLIVIVMGITTLLLCYTTNQKSEESTPLEAIRNGDILLFEGCTFRSDLVRFIQLNRSRFSHVGIASVEHSEIYVIHAHPMHGCIKERLTSMLKEHRATAVVAYRPTVTVAQRDSAVQIAQSYVDNNVMFDSDFNSIDKSKLYCSELVCWAFQGAGVDLVKLQDSVVYPDEFTRMSLLYRVLIEQAEVSGGNSGQRR